MPTIASHGGTAVTKSNTSESSESLLPIPTVLADIKFTDGFHITEAFQEITHKDYEYPSEHFHTGMARPITKIGFPDPKRLQPDLPAWMTIVLEHDTDTIKIAWDRLTAPQPLPPVQIAIRLVHREFMIVGAALKPEVTRATEDTFPLYTVGRASGRDTDLLSSWILFAPVNLPAEGASSFAFEYTILVQERPNPSPVESALNVTIGYIDPEIECDPT